jgi:hypothetical protein
MASTDRAGFWDITLEKWGYALKDLAIRFGLHALGRGLQAVSKMDSRIHDELHDLPEGFVFKISVLPEGPFVVWKKLNGYLQFLGKQDRPADLVMNLKSRETAYMFVTAQIGISDAYARHQVGVEGDLSRAMLISRCIIIAVRYLFPRFMCRRVIRDLPAMGFVRQINRLFVYLLAIPFGII